MNESQPIECTMARLVLQDCEEALNRLRDEPHGIDWRLLWVATMTLLRTVGFVLTQDGERGRRELKEAIKFVCAQRGNKNEFPIEHKIFWEFFCHERNNIVHEYRFSAGQGVTVFPGSNRPNEPSYIMHSSTYNGCDQRDLVKEAIKWWENQIEKIESRATASILEKRL